MKLTLKDKEKTFEMTKLPKELKQEFRNYSFDYYNKKDVKEAVLEFEKRINEAQTEVDVKYFKAVLKEIFGDFSKDTIKTTKDNK